MATLSRFAFLNALTLGGVFVLTGCGGSTEKNSNYTGAYRSAYTITTASEDEVGTFDFTVDVKGNISGLMDNQVGKVREVSGQMDSEGTFNASTFDRNGDVTGRITGTMSIAPTTIGIGTDVISTPVIGGNFSLVEGATTLPVNFVVNAPVNDSSYSAFYASTRTNFNPAVSFGLGQTTLIDSNDTDFSVDRQGRILGTVGGYRIEGQVRNDTRLSGFVIDNDGKQYTFNGIANKVLWDYVRPSITTPGQFTEESDPGVNFQLVWNINGREYVGFIKAFGGTIASTTT